MKESLNHLLKFIFILAVLAGPLQLMAGNVVEIRNAHLGQTIYQVVLSEAVNDLDPWDHRAPGIYSVGINASSHLVVGGKVFGASSVFSGILAQIDSSSGKEAGFDSIAVVDGVLTLFNRRSRFDKPKSVLRLSLNLPLVEPITGLPTAPLKVSAIEDVNIHVSKTFSDKAGRHRDSRLVLLSVKSPNSFGEGFTMAFVLEESRESEGPRVLNQKSFLLNYRFLPEDTLWRLMVRDVNELSKMQVFSHLAAMSVVARSQAFGDRKLVKKWGDRVKGFISNLESRSLQKISSVGVPTFNLFNGQIELRSVPMEFVLRTPAVLGQIFNPITQKWQLIRMDPKEPENSSKEVLNFTRLPLDPRFLFLAEGEVDRTSSGQIKLVADGSSGSDDFVVFNQGRPVFILRDSVTQKYLSSTCDLPELQGIKNLNFVKYQMHGQGLTRFLVLVSRLMDGRDKSVSVLGFESDGSNLRLLRHEELMKGQYLSADEILRRTALLSEQLFFDSKTPPMGASAYIEANEGRATVPFVNVSALMNGQRSHLFLRAVREETVIPPRLVYREFNSSGPWMNRSGFYVVRDVLADPESLEFIDKDLNREDFIPGRLIQMPPDRQGKGLKFLDKAFLSTRSKPNSNSAELFIVPFLASPKGKGSEAKASDLRMGLFFSSSNGSDFVSSFESVVVPFSFEQLAAVKIVQGSRTASGDVAILFFVEQLPGVKEDLAKLQGVYSLNFQFTTQKQGSRNIATGLNKTLTRLSKKWISPQSLKSRVRWDEGGSVYWVEDDSIDINSPQLSVRKLAEPERVLFPNRVYSGISFRPNETLDLMGGLLAGDFFFQSKWLILGKHDMAARFEWAAEIVKEEDSQNKSERRKRVSENAGEFEAYLDHFAAPNSPLRKPGKQILVVEKRFKNAFKRMLARHFLFGKGNFTQSGLGRNLDLYVFNPQTSRGDIEREILRISRADQGRLSFLFADLEDLEKSSLELKQQSRSEQGSFSVKVDSNDVGSLLTEKLDSLKGGATEVTGEYSLFSMLASEGRAKSVLGFRQIEKAPSQLSMMILATPEEIRQMRATHAEESRSGVLDSFSLNTKFLTGTWTLWSPPSRDAPDDVKLDLRKLSEIPVSREEYSMFGNLDEILKDSAQGKMRGKKVILLVPDELKGLVERLVFSRWASPKSEGGNIWSHLNPALNLFRIQNAQPGGVMTQQMVKENFLALQSAHENNRHGVLVGMLETVRQIGRPSGSEGAEFFLVDAASARAEGAFSSDSISQGLGGSFFADPNSNKREALLKSIIELEAELESIIKGSLRIDDNKRKLVVNLEKAIAKRKSELELLNEKSDTREASDRSFNSSSTLPHLLWWIASGGREIQANHSKAWKLGRGLHDDSAVILIGTEAELGLIESDMKFESKFFDLRDSFELVPLKSPDEKTKFRLLYSLFERPEIRSLGYSFEHLDLAPAEAQRQLLALFVNRIDQIARNENKEKTASFIRAFIALRRNLIEDIEWRRRRVLNMQSIEVFFRKVFPLPLNLEILPKEDPLVRVSQVDRTARDLQKNGYQGSVELKRRILETVLSQTRPTDGGRPIPNSQILFGGTSSGKTFLFKVLVETLGLVAYDPNRANNENADYIIVRVDSLTSKASSDPNKRTVAQVQEDILDLISQPKGSRAWILIDDAHKYVDEAVAKELFGFLQYFFDCENGLLRAVKKGSAMEIREVPVKNLNIFMTVNPPSDREVRARFAEDQEKDVKGLVLAGIADKGFKLEESFLARWGDIIHLDRFPRSAKVPALMNHIRQASRNSPNLVLVDTEAIEAVVNVYPNAHARELLAPAASLMTAIPPHLEKGLFYLAVPKASPGFRAPLNSYDDNYLSAEKLRGAIRQLIEIQPIRRQDSQSQIRLLKFLINEYRTLIFTQLVLYVINNFEDQVKANEGPLVRQYLDVFKRNLLAGVAGHILSEARLPIGELEILGADFEHLSKVQLEDFVASLSQERTKFHQTRGESYFPMNFSHSLRRRENFDAFAGVGSYTGTSEVDRNDVLRESVAEIQQVLFEFLKVLLRVQTTEQFNHLRSWRASDVAFWFENLGEQDQESAAKKYAGDLVKSFLDFKPKFVSAKVPKNQSSEDLSFVQQVRVFCYLIDKAILGLPWGTSSKMLLDVVESSADLSLGQRPAFVNYVYNHNISPFAIHSFDFLEQNVALRSKFRELPSLRPVFSASAPRTSKSCTDFTRGPGR